MGTRAIVTKNGEPFVATHWDGYPDGLGSDLIGCKTDEEIIEVARKHTIDFANETVLRKVNPERVEMLARKHKLSLKEIRAGTRRGGIIAADDYEIGKIENYGDFADYQYDLKDGKWYVRALRGAWSESLKKAGAFLPLSVVLAEEAE